MARRFFSHGLFAAMLLAFLFAAGCVNEPPHNNPGTNTAAHGNGLRTMDSVIALLKTGDVVVRKSVGPFSEMLARLNKRDQTFSHCGLVVVENGYPFVYHSIGGEDNADEKLRRDSASFFFSPLRNTAIGVARYTIDSGSVRRLASVITAYYHLAPRFDAKFDLATDSLLYCSEFVYKAFSKLMADTAYIPKSIGYDRTFIGIDDLFLNNHCHIVAKVNYN